MKFIDEQQQLRILNKFIGPTPIASARPVLYTMAGIPASGKTTFLSLQEKQGTLPQDYYYHDPDRVMEELLEYQNDFNNFGAENARSYWELPARKLADELLFPKAVEHRMNIVMDMGLCRSEILDMVRVCRAQGYSVRMQIIYCDLSVAIRRSKKRSRYVPEQEISKRALFLATNIASIRSMADNMQIWDNSDIAKPYLPITPEQAEVSLQQNYGLCSTG
ncbi:MAG: zeta toxin family protein [Methyloligellaceae bacterium]